MLSRRNFLGIAGAAALPLRAQQNGARKLTESLAVIDGGGSNVTAFSSGEGLVLVDNGTAGSGDQVMSGLKNLAPNTKIATLFNTHYHLDQTANNEQFAAGGAQIIAHARTKQWMSGGYWIPDEDRYAKARPKAAWPTDVFQTRGSLKAGNEQIDYGYLIMAHTSGDIYVYFKNANVMAVGDVASPLRDPELDWFTGAWIGGRVDAMDMVLKLTNADTRIVPAYGPVMTQGQFKAEREVMEEVRARLFKQVRQGDGPNDMLEEGLLKNLPRTWKDPEKFLYAACKGCWAHNDKLDANVV